MVIKMCYYDVGTRIPFYVTPSQTGQILAYQIDNYSETTSEFLYVLVRNIVILRLVIILKIMV